MRSSSVPSMYDSASERATSDDDAPLRCHKQHNATLSLRILTIHVGREDRLICVIGQMTLYHTCPRSQAKNELIVAALVQPCIPHPDIVDSVNLVNSALVIN